MGRPDEADAASDLEAGEGRGFLVGGVSEDGLLGAMTLGKSWHHPRSSGATGSSSGTEAAPGAGGLNGLSSRPARRGHLHDRGPDTPCAPARSRTPPPAARTPLVAPGRSAESLVLSARGQVGLSGSISELRDPRALLGPRPFDLPSGPSRPTESFFWLLFCPFGLQTKSVPSPPFGLEPSPVVASHR